MEAPYYEGSEGDQSSSNRNFADDKAVITREVEDENLVCGARDVNGESIRSDPEITPTKDETKVEDENDEDEEEGDEDEGDKKADGGELRLRKNAGAGEESDDEKRAEDKTSEQQQQQTSGAVRKDSLSASFIGITPDGESTTFFFFFDI